MISHKLTIGSDICADASNKQVQRAPSIEAHGHHRCRCIYWGRQCSLQTEHLKVNNELLRSMQTILNLSFYKSIDITTISSISIVTQFFNYWATVSLCLNLVLVLHHMKLALPAPFVFFNCTTHCHSMFISHQTYDSPVGRDCVRVCVRNAMQWIDVMFVCHQSAVPNRSLTVQQPNTQVTLKYSVATKSFINNSAFANCEHRILSTKYKLKDRGKLNRTNGNPLRILDVRLYVIFFILCMTKKKQKKFHFWIQT